MSTKFTAWPFNTAVGSAPRTMPVRLTDVINVLDFSGVDPSGSNDSTSGLQSAITAASTQGTLTNSKLGGAIYVPPGLYAVSSPLTNPTSNSFVKVYGAGKYNTTLHGSVSGYIFDENSGGQFDVIQDICAFNTNSASATGAIRMSPSSGASQNAIINSCQLFGFIGIEASVNVFNLTTVATNITGNGNITGSIGYWGAGGCYGVEVGAYDTGYRISGSGAAIVNCRAETNFTGFVLGGLDSGGNNHAAGGFIDGLTTERNNTGINVANASGFRISGALITGTVDVVGTSTPSYGILISNLANALKVEAVSISAVCKVAGIDISGGGGGGGQISFDDVLVNISTGAGVNWNMPTTNKASFSYLNSNNPTAAMLFSDLPSGANAVEGMEFDITNCNANTFGATAAGGGSTHARVRYNGTTWTVMGI